MGFWTSVYLYDPRKRPPRITTGQIAGFLREFEVLGISKCRNLRAEVMLGPRIDRDRRAMDVEDNKFIGTIMLTSYKARRRDIEVEAASPTELADAIGGEDRAIYRAFISLGDIHDDLFYRIYEPSPQNAHTARLQGLHLNILPIEAATLSADRARMLGWIAFSLGGQGYAWPRSPMQLLDAVTAQPEMRAVEDLMRRTWPIPSKRPGPRQRARRRTLAAEGLWHDPIDAPAQWTWCISGS